jgi:hypothetical protein
VVAHDCARLDGPTGQAQKNPQPTWLVWCLARLVQCGFREQFSRCSNRPRWSQVTIRKCLVYLAPRADSQLGHFAGGILGAKNHGAYGVAGVLGLKSASWGLLAAG